MKESRPILKINHLIKKITKKDAFAAVIVPYGFTKAGLSFDNWSIEDTLIPLSLLTTSATPGTYTK